MSDLSILNVPQISAEQAELENLLASRRPTIAVVRSQEREELRLVTRGAASGGHTKVLCETAGSELGLSLAQDCLNVSLPDGVADVDMAELPEPLAMALAEVALGPVLTALGDLFAEPPRLKAIAADIPETWPRVALESQSDDRPPSVIMHLSAASHSALRDRLRQSVAAPNGAAEGAASIALYASFGSQSLTHAEIRRLVPGSVILVPGAGGPEQATILLGARRRPLGVASLQGSILTIDSIGVPAMNLDDENGDEEELLEPLDDESTYEEESLEPLEDESTFEEESPEPLDDESTHKDGPLEPLDEENTDVQIDDLEVRLDFLLGKTALTFQEIKGLGPGSTITLDAPASGTVGIYASGRRLGSGEIVQIDGSLGVRIVAVNGLKND